MDRRERALCLRVNRGCRRPLQRAFFVGVSRAGDGALWYALMAAVALLDVRRRSAGRAPDGGHRRAGAALYKFLKTRLVRERPFISHAGILCGTAPLDRYSFPSGHTLHAVGFTILAGAHYPLLLPALVPLALRWPPRASCSDCTIRRMSQPVRDRRRARHRDAARRCDLSDVDARQPPPRQNRKFTSSP